VQVDDQTAVIERFGNADTQNAPCVAVVLNRLVLGLHGVSSKSGCEQFCDLLGSVGLGEADSPLGIVAVVAPEGVAFLNKLGFGQCGHRGNGVGAVVNFNRFSAVGG
jgi:hypothetical protein